MIGRGSGFPSATAETEMKNFSDRNQRSTNEKTNGSEGKSKTKPIIHPQRRKIKPQIRPQRWKTKPNTSDSGMLQMHSKAARKLDHTVDYFKC